MLRQEEPGSPELKPRSLAGGPEPPPALSAAVIGMKQGGKVCVCARVCAA